MLSATDPIYLHWAQNLALIGLSLFFLPLSTTIVLWTAIYSFFFHRRTQQRQLKHANEQLAAFASAISQMSWLDGDEVSSPPLTPSAQTSFRGQRGPTSGKAILVTGVSMTKGLTLARLLAKHTPYRIIGADTSPLASGRFSRYLDGFAQLASTPNQENNIAYKTSLVAVIERENVGLWVSCSGVMSAVEDAEVREELDKKGLCKAIQFGVKQTRMLHEKELFVDWLRDNKFLVPETTTITSHEQVLEALYPGNEKESFSNDGRKKFILKPAGVIDSERADMTLLPLRSYAETRNYISKKPISKSASWILQEFIEGEEYCTHALIVHGQVRNFVACPSSELLMHYEALPSKGRLSQAMLEFTRKVASKLQAEEVVRSRGNTLSGGNQDASGTPGHFTGHLSFDFLIKKADLVDDAREIRLYPIECNPRAHTAVALFRNTPELVDGYVEVMNEKTEHSSYRDAVVFGISDIDKTINTTDGSEKTFVASEQGSASSSSSSLSGNPEPVYPLKPQSAYWIGHDMVELLIMPLLQLLTLRTSPLTVVRGVRDFLIHILFWREAAFDVDDPLPSWVLYQLYWPWVFIQAMLQGKKWSRVNVSTGKVFGLE